MGMPFWKIKKTLESLRPILCTSCWLEPISNYFNVVNTNEPPKPFFVGVIVGASPSTTGLFYGKISRQLQKLINHICLRIDLRGFERDLIVSLIQVGMLAVTYRSSGGA